MRISRALTLFTHIIALSGFVAISITGEVGIPVIFIFSSSLILSFVNEKYHKSYYLSGGASTFLAVLLIFYVAAGVFVLGIELFRAILDFLIFTQVLKLLGRKEMRDIVQIYVLSFFQFLAGTIITVDFSYAFAFIIYIAVAIWAIMVYEMRKESMETGSPGDPELVTPLFLSTTFLVGFCVFLIAAVIFVSVPRLRGSYFRADFLKTEELRSGFSDEVKLGRVGEIKLDSSPVMMVRILNMDKDDIPDPVYWRGVALDEFDGTSWRVGDSEYRVYKASAGGSVTVSERGGEKLSQEIITEPLDTDVLFAANSPSGFRSVPGRRVAAINDSFFLPDRVSNRIKYYAYSDVRGPVPEELRNDNDQYSEVHTRQYIDRYLQLPPLGEGVKTLALEITSLDRNNYDKAVSIKRYLLANLSYTRTLEEGSHGFPLEDFLFRKKEGHCEYFATAMVVLLREAGIPARVVNGFLGGQWNDHGQFFLVRQSDAHSWVEVLFPAHGWVTFDPTPPADEGASLTALSFMGSYIDYLKFRWSRYVIDFSQRDQIRLFNEVRDKWQWQNRKISNALKFKFGLDRRLGAAVVLIALLAWVVVMRPGIGSILVGRHKKPEHKASLVYGKALRLLSKRGYPKPEFMTPREFSGFLKEKDWAGFVTMDRLTDKYMSIRFGGSADEKELELLDELLDKLRVVKK